MKTVKTGKCEILFVPCNEDATDPIMGNHCVGWKSNQDWQNIDSNGWRYTKLGLMAGKNNYEVIGFTDELTEEECNSIVESRVLIFKRWKSYTFDHWNLTCARHSFHTLLIDNGIIGRHIVLRKIEH